VHKNYSDLDKEKLDKLIGRNIHKRMRRDHSVRPIDLTVEAAQEVLYLQGNVLIECL
jgi:hypothetical protein